MDLDIKTRFTYHPPSPGQIPSYEMIRNEAFDFAQVLEQLVPECRELATAMTYLDAVVMFANAGIARNTK